jgi:hypothetical protein
MPRPCAGLASKALGRLVRTGSTLNLVSFHTCSTVRIGKVLTAQPLAYYVHPNTYSHRDHDQHHISPVRDIILRLSPRLLILHQNRFFPLGKLFALPHIPQTTHYNRHPGSITGHAEYTTSSAVTPTRRDIQDLR